MLTKLGNFSTKSFYEGLDHDPFGAIIYKGIGKLGIPFKVNLFLWTSILDKILTLNHLKSRGWNLA